VEEVIMVNKRSKAERMPWAEALKLFGEEALKAGHSHQRVSNWRRDGVPGNIATQLYRTKVNADRASQRPSDLLDAARKLEMLGSLPPQVLGTLDAIQQVWSTTRGEGARWRAIELMLAEVARMAVSDS
jgi:hypothetical protein